jgi:hypothetical protein
MLVLEFGYPMKKSVKAPRYPPALLGGAQSRSLCSKPAVVPAFILYELEFGETEILADLPSHWL